MLLLPMFVWPVPLQMGFAYSQSSPKKKSALRVNPAREIIIFG
jgi:hypothetical protein